MSKNTKVSTKTAAKPEAATESPVTAKNTARKRTLVGHDESLKASEGDLAAFDVLSVQTKSDGVIHGLKPLTKYHLVECVDAEIQPIASALIGDKIRRGVLITKLFEQKKG